MSRKDSFCLFANNLIQVFTSMLSFCSNRTPYLIFPFKEKWLLLICLELLIFRVDRLWSRRSIVTQFRAGSFVCISNVCGVCFQISPGVEFVLVVLSQ
jgi:hypothetical protein